MQTVELPMNAPFICTRWPMCIKVGVVNVSVAGCKIELFESLKMLSLLGYKTEASK
jgi:hypothetical protein